MKQEAKTLGSKCSICLQISAESYLVSLLLSAYSEYKWLMLLVIILIVWLRHILLKLIICSEKHWTGLQCPQHPSQTWDKSFVVD